MLRTSLFFLVLLLALPAFAQNLIPNGDFDRPDDARPPTGWAMWGDDRYKDRANYTRDTGHPHTGAACYRIHHPKDTDGYTVLSPDRAIKAQPGMTYTVRFWARADAPGDSLVGLGAYERIDPYIDAPPAGFWSFQVGKEWKEFTFVSHEGLDFFADTSGLLMLTFRATTRKELERTLWIDDVSVTAAPKAEDILTLRSPRSLKPDPIEHGVSPGEHFNVRVHSESIADTVRRATGISFHRVRGHPNQPFTKQGDGPSRYNLAPETEQGIKDLRVPLTRFYALADEPLGAEWSIDRVAELCKKLEIPMESVVLELEEESASKRFAPEAWAKAVKHSVERGYGFRHWEVGNEVYAAMFNANGAFKSADEYIAHFIAVSRAIRAVQPKARIGVSVADNIKWGDYVLAKAAGHYDFVVPHFYAFPNAYADPFERIVLEQNRLMLEKARLLSAVIGAANPQRDVELLDTEWGLHSQSRTGGRADEAERNANIVGALHRAVRMIYYAKGGYVSGASTWGMFGRASEPGFCVLPIDEPPRRSMLFWLYYHFNRHLGDRVLRTSGTAPFVTDDHSPHAFPQTPILVTKKPDGTICVIVANGSWDKPVELTLSFDGVPRPVGNAIALSQDSLDAPAILPDAPDPTRPVEIQRDGDTLRLTIPAHAVVFIDLRAGA